jgi:hypothetical protein
MLKIKIKRRAAEASRALAKLVEIEASIVALNDEDLLDLADIFSVSEPSSIGDIASAEMTRRNLSF